MNKERILILVYNNISVVSKSVKIGKFIEQFNLLQTRGVVKPSIKELLWVVQIYIEQNKLNLKYKNQTTLEQNEYIVKQNEYNIGIISEQCENNLNK